MNVIDFPLGRLKKMRELKNLQTAGFGSAVGRIYDTSSLECMFDGSESQIVVNPNEISQDNFLKYLSRFECFNYFSLDCAMEIIDHFLSDRLTDAQDRAIEAVLEVTSFFTFGFSVVDAFEIWNRADREAYLSILSDYSSVMSTD